ncbi:MAG TPA: phosphoadenosine phosphosulfate reductase family protein, partial [Candidatus Omnitrophota bacterium]|nr:phosphoadenosine phosphosulfate reductase family protein [Candidatus Omnitrophota bacterium]
MSQLYAYLDELEARSIFIIRESYWKYSNKLACLWSIGKDSTTMVHLMRKAFLGKVPVPVIHIDTGRKFRQIYEFRDTYAAMWGLDLIVARNEPAMQQDILRREGRFSCCNSLKTEALKQIIARKGYEALFVGIRRDEHAIRAKERYFSQRDRDFKWDYGH